MSPIAAMSMSIQSQHKSTLSHQAWVACGSATILFALAKSVLLALESRIWVQPIMSGIVGFLMADLTTGVYHWVIDNYGDASTPFFGSQIQDFQGHHKWPSSITRNEVANNLHDLARAVTFTVLPINLFCNDPTMLGFMVIWSGCIMFSQLFHAWAHRMTSKLPRLVVALQNAGVLVSAKQHAEHHRPPYNSNYCIVSGAWNQFLDNHKVWEALEMVVFRVSGVKPRSWTDTNSSLIYRG